MDHQIQRGFLRHCANSEQWAKRIQAWELRQAPGRYLTPCEIMRLLYLDKLGQKTPAQLTAMGDLWQDFSGRQWKEKQIEEKLHDERCVNAPGSWCKCRTPQAELHAWDDYVIKHWREPKAMAPTEEYA